MWCELGYLRDDGFYVQCMLDGATCFIYLFFWGESYFLRVEKDLNL